MTSESVITFAHRGGRSDHPENTLEAFSRSLDLGARGIETDAWLSADNEVVLNHGLWLGPRAFFRRVTSLSAEKLAKYGVIRLQDMYEKLGSEFELSIDLKHSEVATATVSVGQSFHALGRLWLCTPKVATLETLAKSDARLVHSPGKSHALAPAEFERHIAGLAKLGIAALNLHQSDWNKGLVVLAHRFDVRAFAWGVEEDRHLREMARIGIDAIYSDHVDRMVTVFGKRSV